MLVHLVDELFSLLFVVDHLLNLHSKSHLMLSSIPGCRVQNILLASREVFIEIILNSFYNFLLLIADLIFFDNHIRAKVY